MPWFLPAAGDLSQQHRRLYAIYEIAFTIADFAAAFLFIIGSILFFDAATTRTGTWLFLIGSVFFALKPAIRMSREFHFWRTGAYQRLADRALDP